MQIGIALQDTARIDIGAVAARAEALGFESVWVPEHTAYPVEPGRMPEPGEEWPDMARVIDPFVALAAAAAATRTVRLGTGVCLVPQRHPLLTAKAVASLDAVSGGRFLFGVGAGWLESESRLFGVDFPRRWSQTRDYLRAMKAFWQNPRAEYHGPYADFPEVWGYPPPVQRPHPPILVAGVREGVAERIVTEGDGWIPIPRRIDPPQLEIRRIEIENAMGAAGRDLSRFTVTVYGARPDRDLNHEYAAAGADRLVHFLPAGPDTGEALEHLERLAGAVL